MVGRHIGGSQGLPRGGQEWHGGWVTAARDIRHLALVGFMGAGKSTVGRLLARQLHMDLVDTDEAIELRTGKRVAEIFEQYGEPTFRLWERQTMEELLEGEERILATGGGLVCQPGNMEILKRRSLVVCLWASPETLWERVRHQNHRPLLQVAEPEAELRRLLALREPYYREADVLVNSGLRSLREVAVQVAHHFQSARQAGVHG